MTWTKTQRTIAMTLHASRGPLTVDGLCARTKISKATTLTSIASLAPVYVEVETPGDTLNAPPNSPSKYRLTERGRDIANNIAAALRAKP